MEETERKCIYCSDQTVSELRPYGPEGAWVCYDCAMETPERKQQAVDACQALFSAAMALSDVIAIGTEEGPTPIVRGHMNG